MRLTPAGRLILVVLALLIACGLSFFSIRAALASHYSDQGTLEGNEKAVHLEPTNPVYWVRLGDFYQKDFQHGDSHRAIRAYRAALSLNPNSTEAWLGLAYVYEAEGQLSAANESLVRAKRSYPLSADVSWKYANFLLRQGDLDSALEQARQAVDQEPRRAWEAIALFYRFDPDVSALVDRLLPGQEGAYLDVIWGLNRIGLLPDALKVWDRLFALNQTMPKHDVPAGSYQSTQVTLFSLVEQLLAKGYLSDAERVWREVVTFMKLPLMHDPPSSLIWDGGFEAGITGPLSWHYSAPVGSVIGFSKATKHSGDRSLEIKFDGKHDVDFHGVCQFVVVDPGQSYDFSAWLRTENIITDRGLSFRLNNALGEQPEISTSDVTGTHPWMKVFASWKATPGVHLLQICVSRPPSSQQYSQVAGTAWVDDVELVPVLQGKSSF